METVSEVRYEQLEQRAMFAVAQLGEDATELGPAGSSTLITGQILSENNEPLAGVPVELAGRMTVTDSQGFFTIELPWSALPTDSFNIPVPAGDPYFDPYNTGTVTIPMQRARYDGTTGDSVANPLQHQNLITSFLDASMVYGSDADRAAALRTFVDGKLKTSDGELLPLNNLATFPDGMLDNDNAGPYDAASLFVGGDVRANENVALTSLHTLLVREHNRLADEIKTASPSLTDEEIYQQARRLVGGIVQQITYYEYLPIMLGTNALPTYSGYDDAVDPAVSAIFSSAAYRVGHTQLFSEIQRLDENLDSLPGGSLELKFAFFNPQAVADDGIEPYLRGLFQSQSEEIDAFVIDDVRNFLFGPPGAGGLDLPAINIQRGRDFGLPSYNQARLDFGLPAVTSFSEITSDPVVAMRLEAAYGDVDLIDVWVGGIAEDHVAGAQVGPLFQKIIADQFERSRDGDRFYFENGQFTAAELALIQGTTLTSLIERNTSITGMNSNAFLLSGAGTSPTANPTLATIVSTDYRTADGSGNNLLDPSAGATNDNLALNFTVSYGDGYFTPAGADRPGTREISNTVMAQSASVPNSGGTSGFFVFWGQLLDHDLDLTPGGVSNDLNIDGSAYVDPVTNVTYEYTSGKVNVLLGHEVYSGAENVILPAIQLAQDESESGHVFAHFSGDIKFPGLPQTFDISVSASDFSMAEGGIKIGWKVIATGGSSLDPAAVLIFNSQGQLVPRSIVWQNTPSDGNSSFVMANLTPGDYHIVVTGQNGTTGSFILQALLTGDSEGGGTVSVLNVVRALEHAIASSISGSASNYLLSRFDVDLDGFLTESDIEYMAGNLWSGTTLQPIYLSAQLDPASDTGILGDGITSTAMVHLCGVATPGALVTVDVNGDGVIDGQMIAGMYENGASYGFDVTLTEGANHVIVTATDEFGQTLTRKLTLTLDTIAPHVVATGPSSDGLVVSANTSNFTLQVQLNEFAPLSDILAAMTVIGNISGIVTPLNPRWNNLTRIFSFDLSGSLPDTSFSVVFGSAFTDPAGNPFTAYSFSFQRAVVSGNSQFSQVLAAGIEYFEMVGSSVYFSSEYVDEVLSLIDLLEGESTDSENLADEDVDQVFAEDTSMEEIV
ncbi:Ig-like domain-containing protein [Blastopirellula sp. JC732]|uniref:Ig-like domain-containing protein n=1 Tax=Blastopirellula sediminis TaxID=2894196 RepID=A0A9X1SEY0_9BACT|nr:peroxidase family protein [Blastopirellula sediminis]MCC9607970.1 Ig-like domain-containing protein [Blastopirellula sediminis]MCC9627237.1 Ig-like domain-containing protein [Blastopirellula sediminis]